MNLLKPGSAAPACALASAFWLLLSCATASDAATFCVTTGNQLNTALNTAGFNQQDDVIKVATGTLTSDVQAPGDYQWQFKPNIIEYSYNLTISGGWNGANGCQSQITQDPAQTKLDARYFGPVFTAEMVFDAFTGDLTISNLTFYRGQSASFPSSVGIQMTAVGGTGGIITVDNILVTAGRSGAASGKMASFQLNQSGLLKVRNSQFLNNSFTHSSSGGVLISTINSAVGFFTNNSISGNTATVTGKGLSALGVVTLSNNAAADNTSTASSSFDFYSNAPTSLTLRNNHFQTRGTFNGTPFSETGTTTGAANWAQVGFRMVPDAVSPLRDSGINSPSGGIPSIDFSGGPRIVNSTIDRGAVEAPAITRMGPALTATTPLNNSMTTVVGDPDTVVESYLLFSVSGGLGSGTTQLTCISNGGPVGNIRNSVQTIAVGGTVTPVFMDFFVGQSPQNAAMSCIATRENAPAQNFFFNFTVGSDVIFHNSFE